MKVQVVILVAFLISSPVVADSAEDASQLLKQKAAFPIPPGLEAVGNVIVGFLYGLGSEVGADDALSCLSEVTHGGSKIIDSIMHLSLGTGLDVLIGMEEMSEAISHFSMAIFEC
jgi:hypothetical protein